MFLKVLKDLVYEETPDQAAAPQAAPVIAHNVVTNTPAVPSVNPAEVQALDQKLQAALSSALQDSGIVAYKALDDVLDSLADIVPNEDLRYKKALEILGKQGYTLPGILSDIDKAIGALEDSSREFEASQKKQSQASVGALHQSVETLTQQITTKQAQLTSLQQEISALTQKRDTDAASISSAQAQIDHVGRRYDAVYQASMQTIQKQRAAVERRSLTQ